MKSSHEIHLDDGEIVAAGRSVGGIRKSWLRFGSGAETIEVHFDGHDTELPEKIARLIEQHRSNAA